MEANVLGVTSDRVMSTNMLERGRKSCKSGKANRVWSREFCAKKAKKVKYRLSLCYIC